MKEASSRDLIVAHYPVPWGISPSAGFAPSAPPPSSLSRLVRGTPPEVPIREGSALHHLLSVYGAGAR